MSNLPEHRAFLGQLLTDLARRTDGALDFWTIVCINPDLADSRAFLEQQSELLHALVVVLQSRVSADKAAAPLLTALRENCEQWESAFRLLADFRDRAEEEVVSAI